MAGGRALPCAVAFTPCKKPPFTPVLERFFAENHFEHIDCNGNAPYAG